MRPEIHKEPHFEEMTQHVRSGRCIVFIGAGLSAPHYALWHDLISRLCVACGMPDVKVAPGADATSLTRLADEARDKDSEAYLRVLDEEYGRVVGARTRSAYDLLLRLPFISYVTTNFDPLLEHASRGHEVGRLFVYPTLKAAELEHRGLFHIHGLIRDDWSAADHEIVLGYREFEKAYGNMSLLLGFLLQVFTFYPVLFIGSSLREPQLQRVFRICRDIRQQIETEHSRRAPPRYILLPMKFQDVSGKGSGVDRRALQVEEEENRAFEELDIYVVRYNEIDRYHSGIESVLEDWCNLLPRQPEPGFEGPL